MVLLIGYYPTNKNSLVVQKNAFNDKASLTFRLSSIFASSVIL